MEFSLEEYKQLSEELRIYLKQREFNITTARIVTFAALTSSSLTSSFSPSSKNYILLAEIILIISAFFVLVMWYDSIRRLLAMFRISTYLIVFYEQECKELQWHSLVAYHKIHKTFLHRILGNAMFPIMAFALLALFNYLGFSKLKIQINRLNIFFLLLLDSIFLFLIVLLIKESLSLEIRRKQDIKFWSQLKNKLQKENF